MGTIGQWNNGQAPQPSMAAPKTAGGGSKGFNWGGLVMGLLGKGSDDSRRSSSMMDSQASTLNEQMMKMKQDRGFYGHSRVPGMKQDNSGFAKL